MHRLHTVGNDHDGHGVERMRRIGRTVGIDSVVGIAVVGNHDDLVTVLLSSLDNFGDAPVDGLHGLHDGIVDARMADHVAVGEIQADKVELPLTECSNQFISDFRPTIAHILAHTGGVIMI